MTKWMANNYFVMTKNSYFPSTLSLLDMWKLLFALVILLLLPDRPLVCRNKLKSIMPERIPGDRHGKIKFTKTGKTANNSTKIQ